MHEEIKNIISQSMNERTELEQKLIELAWEDENFKQELINNPKAVFSQQSGQQLPEDLEVEIVQETPNKVYLVLPHNPVMTEEQELSEEALESVAGGVCVGWSFAKACVAWTAVRNANKLA